jgi:hypothetical protein
MSLTFVVGVGLLMNIVLQGILSANRDYKNEKLLNQVLANQKLIADKLGITVNS